jgi:hypothetical protein
VRRVQRDADAARHVELQRVDRDRALELLEDAFGEQDGGRLVLEVRQHQAELVPAQTRHHVIGSKGGGQPRTDLLQEQIAEVMAERVVDLLEVVEVDQHDRDERGIRVLGDGLAELLLEQDPVRQVGQRIMQRLVLVLALAGRELLRCDLKRLRSHEHLPRERERRDEHGDRPHAKLQERNRDDDREEREPHVAHDELAEDADVHVAQDGDRAFAAAQMEVPGHEQDIDGIPDDRREEHRRAETPPDGHRAKRRELVEQEALQDHRPGELPTVPQALHDRDLATELAPVTGAEERDRPGDRRRVDQRDGQLQGEAEAERHADRGRDGQQVDNGDRHHPHEQKRARDFAAQELTRVQPGLDHDEQQERNDRRQLIEPQPKPSTERACDGLVRRGVGGSAAFAHAAPSAGTAASAATSGSRRRMPATTSHTTPV